MINNKQPASKDESLNAIFLSSEADWSYFEVELQGGGFLQGKCKNEKLKKLELASEEAFVIHVHHSEGGVEFSFEACPPQTPENLTELEFLFGENGVWSQLVRSN